MITRTIYYAWVILFFPIAYLLIPGLENALEWPGYWIAGIFLFNAVLMGWIGDAIIFRRDTIGGKKIDSNAFKWLFVAFVVLVPVFAMGTDVGAQ